MFDGDSFEEAVRALAREAARSLENAIESVDTDRVAEMIGIDPDMARDWVQNAGGWLQEHADTIGDEMASRVADTARSSEPESPRDPEPAPSSPHPGFAGREIGDEHAFSGAGPHPLDVPTDEHGLALAALASGRWTVEPGTDALAAKGEGPAPQNALGVVRELRVRDWITAEGELTIVGRHALGRWLEVTSR